MTHKIGPDSDVGELRPDCLVVLLQPSSVTAMQSDCKEQFVLEFLVGLSKGKLNNYPDS